MPVQKSLENYWNYHVHKSYQKAENTEKHGESDNDFNWCNWNGPKEFW